jgi:aryl-alcohol dehydrogenase-like predicted oxidoreductase
MSQLSSVVIAKTKLTIPSICLGTSALGDMPDTYGYAVDEARARATLDAIFDGPIAFLDTSRNYGAFYLNQNVNFDYLIWLLFIRWPTSVR